MPQVRVTPIEIAQLRFDLQEAYPLPPGRTAGTVELPVLAYHLALPDRSVLVDAPAYDADATPEEYLLPGYVAPPPLSEQLRSAGIDPASITHVVITHAHFDHLGALVDADGKPCFPHARHLLGRGDFDPPNLVPVARSSLLPIEAAGLLTLVDGDADLGGGLRLLAAPGESPGHMLAYARSGDDVVVVAGDLYHHAVEFDDPDLNVVWVDREAMRGSKEALLERAEREHARAYFSHIRGAHRVARVRGERRWVPADEG